MPGTVLTNRSDNHEELVIYAAKKGISLGSVPTSRTDPLEEPVTCAMLRVISPGIALTKKKVVEVVIAAPDLKKEAMARTDVEADSAVVVGAAVVEAAAAVVPDLTDTHETAKPE